MSEQNPQQCDCEFCVNDRAERDRLVARLTEAANVVRQAKAVMGDANAEIDRLRADLAAERERAEKLGQKASRRSQLMAMLTEERNQIDKQRGAAEQRAAQAEALCAGMRSTMNGAEDELAIAQQGWEAAEAARVQAEAGSAVMRAALMRISRQPGMESKTPCESTERRVAFRQMADYLAEIADAALAESAGREWLEAADKQHRHLDYMTLLNHRTHATDGSDYKDCPHDDCRYTVSLRARWSAVRGQ